MILFIILFNCRQEEAYTDCSDKDPQLTAKLNRILGNKLFQLKDYQGAFDCYFKSDLGFEGSMRIVYYLYTQNQHDDFVSVLSKYLLKLLNAFKQTPEGKFCNKYQY